MIIINSLVINSKLAFPPSVGRFWFSGVTLTIAFSTTGLGSSGTTGGTTTPPPSEEDFLILTTFLNSS